MCILNKTKSFLLGILVSGLFGSVLAVDTSPAYNFYPLYFEYVNKSDSAAQKAEWDYLMKYKMYGRRGILFKCGKINIPDKTGWFGTSQGGWKLSNQDHVVGGPILIGGNVEFEDGHDSLTTGPVRITGSVTTTNFNSPNYVGGNVCIAGSVGEKFVSAVSSEHQYFSYGTNGQNGLGYASCPSSGKDSVPLIKTNLAIPKVDTTLLPPYRTDRSMIFDAHHSSGNIDPGAIYVNDTIGYIDVPPSTKEDEEERDKDVYDLHVPEIHLLNKSRLVIRMPSGGRLTRIFINGVFEMTAHPFIQVTYMAENATYNESTHQWSGASSAVQNDKYMGNLLFYTNERFAIPAIDAVDSIQGTFISAKTISVEQHMTLAGQLLADSISINAEFDGSGFIFKQFDPPRIDPGALANGLYYENDSLVAINIELDKAPTTDVRFDYYFKVAKQEGNHWATMDDFLILHEGEFPMDSLHKDSVRIYADYKTPTDSVYKAWIRIKKDNVVEGDEYFRICVSNLSGAIIKGNYDAEGKSICMPLTIIDSDNYPPVFKEDTTLKVTENVKGDIAGTIVTTDKDGNEVTYSIAGGTGADIFVIGEKSGVLSLKPDVSVDYEYDQLFTVQIAASDGFVPKPVLKTYTVKVVDVNENPIAKDSSYKIKENSPAGTVVGYYFWEDLDVASKFTNHNIAVAVAGEGSDTDLFNVFMDGTITVKEGAVLDYEAQKVHHLTIRVQDSTDVKLYDDATITISLIDEDDGPKIIIVPEDDPKNDPDKHFLVLNNGDKKGAKENNEKGALAGTVKASCSAINCKDNLTFTMLEDTSGLFAMNSTTGEITVKDSMVLDYEKINEYLVKVYVCDNNPKGVEFNQYDTASVLIRVIDVNELPSLKEGKLFVDEHQPAGTLVANMDTLTSDLDTAYMFTQHKFRGIGGDTSVFKVSEKGAVTTRISLDYVQDSTYTLVVEVIDKADTTLRDTATMSVKVKNVNDNPYFTSPDTFEFPENPKNGYVIGTLTAEDKDLDDSVFTFKLKSKVDYVTVSEDGVMKVKDSTAFDFEKANKLTFEVTVTDQNGGSSDTLITVFLKDVNEAVTLPPQTFTVREDTDTGVVIGKIVAKDLDTAKAFTQHTFKLIGRSVGFKVDTDGSITLMDSLDYETDSIYVLKVTVTDGEFCDTNDITIKVLDVMEKSKVVITRGETPDSVWLMPDTIFTNRPTIDLEWTEDGVKRSGTETLKNGKNVIIKKYENPTKNVGGADTVVIFVNSDTPEVIVSTKAKKVTADNIYTVVQEKEKGDSAYYVNNNNNDIFVSVKDPVSSKVDTFTVSLELDSLNVAPTTFTKTMKKISDAKLTLDRNATTEKTTTQLNGDVYATTYKETVNGNEVTITYYTDFGGALVKGESGKKEIKISYPMTIDGREVVVSYKADASTGEMIEGRNGAVYTVSYDYVDKSENSVNVAYGVTEDGAFVMDNEGNAGYEVSYSYTNKYGNTSTKSVFIVVDKVAPKVEIVSPVDGTVLHSNFVDVKWTVDGVVQDTLVTQGLQKGTFPIVRYYRDKAGNTDSAVVIVVVKNAKDVEISVEKPVTKIDDDRVAKYYGKNPPKKNETFAVTLYNAADGVENEVLIGGDMKTKAGSGNEPYPGLKGHLGPTLTIDAKLPVVNSMRGLATLDDLVKDGVVAVEGVDAKNSKKVSAEKYVEEYCTAEFAKSLPSDISKANLFKTTLHVDVWIYTNLGQFVDKISFSIDADDPKYVNDAGLLSMFLELKPDGDGFVRTKEGKLLATGAYVYKTEVNMRSTLSCDLPPVSDKGNKASKKGARRKVSEELLKPFGYKRPDGK